MSTAPVSTVQCGWAWTDSSAPRPTAATATTSAIYSSEAPHARDACCARDLQSFWTITRTRKEGAMGEQVEQVSVRDLQGRRVAVLMTDGVEQVEYTEPRSFLERLGVQVTLVSPKQAG